jgi:hypothetical protein
MVENGQNKLKISEVEYKGNCTLARMLEATESCIHHKTAVTGRLFVSTKSNIYSGTRKVFFIFK